MSSKWLIAVVDESLTELEVEFPKIEKELPKAFTGLVIGITTLASSPFPLPIP
ncbi:hypothetical protein L313_1416 [Acinetobacter haemolyticus CIP 64.3 = MTCC 9819]|nr:hypothetical protein L313_1416 [Acinetobacter haemolyticus CIP 64.3 = MTCC 9819]